MLMGAETGAEITFAMDSRYVSEGRDNLESGGIVSADVSWSKEMGKDGTLCLGAWYADAWDEPYSELNLSVGYTVDLDPVELGLSYTWLDFIEDDVDDQELQLSLGFNVKDSVDMSIGMVYSEEADGTFLEVGIAREYAIKDGVVVVPFAILGINEGYVSDEHDGLNHLNVGLETSWNLSESVSLGAYMSYTMGLEEDADESLEDFFYGGLCLTFSR